MAAIEWLDAADGLSFIQKCKDKIHEVCSVNEGNHVLDVGCGVGQEVERYANLVGKNVRVVGMDISQAIIREARARLRGKGLPVDFLVGSAE